MSEKDSRACYKQDDTNHHLPSKSDRVRNGFCKTDLAHGLKINGMKMNGHCASSERNGTISNGHITNGHCLMVDGSACLEENDLRKNGYNVNGQCSVVRCHQKDNFADNRSSSDKMRSTIGEEDSITENEEQNTSQSQVSDMSETTHLSHVKVCFFCYITECNTDIKE